MKFNDEELQLLKDMGRSFTKTNEEWELDSDQKLRKPQPPLVKAPVSDIRIKLPKNFEDLKLENDLVKIMYMRKTQRVYTEESIDLLTLSFLIWAQQGIKSIRGKHYATLRTVPSGGGRHPFELYMAVKNVEGLKQGLYHYLPMEHELELLEELDFADETVKKTIDETMLGQKWTSKSNVIFYYSLIPYRCEWRYSVDCYKPLLIDAGHITENLYIACAAANLGTCAIGSLSSSKSTKLFGLDGEEEYMFYASTVGTVDASNADEEEAFYAFVKDEE